MLPHYYNHECQLATFEFQADDAETAKALSVNRRRVHRVMKSLLDLERSRLSVHGLHSSHKFTDIRKYLSAVPYPRTSVGGWCCYIFLFLFLRNGHANYRPSSIHRLPPSSTVFHHPPPWFYAFIWPKFFRRTAAHPDFFDYCAL